MYLHEVLSDVRAYLAMSIYSWGIATGMLISMIIYFFGDRK